ncbi:MAG TPA: hypothetical protein VFJ07_20840, partial [Streptosporangiaceae bacterium]|nr:hypothetical protein [Streptosporangiaceae bacterium]
MSKGELECYDPANVAVAGTALNLSLTRQPHSCGGRVRPYSSGMINTDGKFHFGADWEPRSITYYYDGRVVGRIRSGVTHAPMYLILNNAATHLYQIPL